MLKVNNHVKLQNVLK